MLPLHHATSGAHRAQMEPFMAWWRVDRWSEHGIEFVHRTRSPPSSRPRASRSTAARRCKSAAVHRPALSAGAERPGAHPIIKTPSTKLRTRPPSTLAAPPSASRGRRALIGAVGVWAVHPGSPRPLASLLTAGRRALRTGPCSAQPATVPTRPRLSSPPSCHGEGVRIRVTAPDSCVALLAVALGPKGGPLLPGLEMVPSSAVQPGTASVPIIPVVKGGKASGKEAGGKDVGTEGMLEVAGEQQHGERASKAGETLEVRNPLIIVSHEPADPADPAKSPPPCWCKE